MNCQGLQVLRVFCTVSSDENTNETVRWAGGGGGVNRAWGLGIPYCTILYYTVLCKGKILKFINVCYFIHCLLQIYIHCTSNDCIMCYGVIVNVLQVYLRITAVVESTAGDISRTNDDCSGKKRNFFLLFCSFFVPFLFLFSFLFLFLFCSFDVWFILLSGLHCFVRLKTLVGHRHR